MDGRPKEMASPDPKGLDPKSNPDKLPALYALRLDALLEIKAAHMGVLEAIEACQGDRVKAALDKATHEAGKCDQVIAHAQERSDHLLAVGMGVSHDMAEISRQIQLQGLLQVELVKGIEAIARATEWLSNLAGIRAKECRDALDILNNGSDT